MWYLIILLKVSTAYLAYPEGTSLMYMHIYEHIHADQVRNTPSCSYTVGKYTL